METPLYLTTHSVNSISLTYYLEFVYLVAKQLYWNHFSACVFSCEFAAYFQNTFSEEHIWKADSDLQWFIKKPKKNKKQKQKKAKINHRCLTET